MNDPVQLPRDLSFLQISVTYNQIDIKHVDTLEAAVLGQERVNIWSFCSEQRLADMEDPHVELK